MLSLYGSLKVPGVDHVIVYRDDEDPHKFYMMSEFATIARDDEGEPLFTFILYARDVDRLAPEDREVERAYLALTTQAAVSPEDEEKIRNYLRQKLNGERQRGYRFLRLPISRVEPVLSYPPVFTQGTVEFATFSEDLVRFSAGSSQPSLLASNIATFSQTLSQDGAELFRQSVEQGLMPAIVNYQLSFLARIPAITIHIYGSRRDFYEELKRHTIVTHIKKKNGKVVYKKTWPEIGSLKEFREIFHSLTIDIDDGDFRDADPGDDVTQQLEELAFSILQSNILPSFFETAFEPATEEQSSNKWLTEIEKEMEGEIDVWIRRRDVIEKGANPNAALSRILTPEEIEAHTAYVDLSQAYFQELDVTINANVNFESDPVYALKVFLDYDHQDDLRNVRVKKAKELLFRSADEVQRFRQIMAKGSDGAPKDSYKHWSEIIYKDTGETIRVPRQGALESRERQLVISYRRLGFVKVNLVLGAMPDNVRSVEVKMNYPGSSAPTAQQSFELTRDKPTAGFFTYTGHTGDPRPYRYQISYVLTDGQRMDMPEQSSQSEVLTITDPFEQTVTTRFLAQADFSVVEKIIVDARYRDPVNDFEANHHAELISNGETSAWTFSLRNPSQREIEYDELIIYRNGSRSGPVTKPGLVGETIPVGIGAVDALEVTVDAGLVNWSRYARVLVYLEYEHVADGDKEDTRFMFRPETSDDIQTWKVLLRDGDQKSYRYRVRYIGLDSSDNHDIDWTATTDEFLILQ